MKHLEWADAVERARELVLTIAVSKWDLGDLAVGLFGADDDARARQFADEIGLSAAQVKQYRRVAAFWPASDRKTAVSWTVYRDLSTMGGTLAIARKALRDLTKRHGNKVGRRDVAAYFDRPVSDWAPEREPVESKVATVRRLLADPEVAVGAFDDDKTLAKATRAMTEIHRQRIADYEPTPTQDAFAKASAFEQVVSHVNSAAYQLRLALKIASELNLTTRQRNLLTDRLSRVLTNADWFSSVLTSDYTVDDVERFLEESAK